MAESSQHCTDLVFVPPSSRVRTWSQPSGVPTGAMLAFCPRASIFSGCRGDLQQCKRFLLSLKSEYRDVKGLKRAYEKVIGQVR